MAPEGCKPASALQLTLEGTDGETIRIEVENVVGVSPALAIAGGVGVLTCAVALVVTLRTVRKEFVYR